MEENKRLEWLLESLLHVIGRAVIKVNEVCEIVGARKKQIKAYNLCDGSLTFGEIVKKAGLDKGSLSRSIDRWVKSGIVFRFAEGKELKPLHVFPIPENSKVEAKSKGKRKKQ